MAGKLLSKKELGLLSRKYSKTKMTVDQIVVIFQEKGFKFSKATFRKYVQAGLLPHAERVGIKGRNSGSYGLYPVETLTIINQLLRHLYDDMLTIEEILSKTTLPMKVALLTVKLNANTFVDRVNRFLADGDWDEVNIKRLRNLVNDLDNRLSDLEDLF